MRVYVAAKFEERAKARDWMSVLERAGHTITYDWTLAQNMSPDQAVKDKQGVMTADALLFVCDRNLAYCGALVEVGMALARGIPVYFTGHALDGRLIFAALPEIRYDVDALMRETPEKLAWAKEAADRRAERIQGYSNAEPDATKAAPEQAHDFTSLIKNWTA